MEKAQEQLKEKIKEEEDQNECSVVAGIDGSFYKSYCANFDTFAEANNSNGKFCS